MEQQHGEGVLIEEIAKMPAQIVSGKIMDSDSEDSMLTKYMSSTLPPPPVLPDSPASNGAVAAPISERESARGSFVYEFPSFNPAMMQPQHQQMMSSSSSSNGHLINNNQHQNNNHNNSNLLQFDDEEEAFSNPVPMSNMNGHHLNGGKDNEDENTSSDDEENCYSLLDARSQEVTVQSQGHVPDHLVPDANVYEDNIMIPAPGQFAGGDGDDEGNYERLAVDPAGHVNGVIEPETCVDEADDDYCTLSGQRLEPTAATVVSPVNKDEEEVTADYMEIRTDNKQSELQLEEPDELAYEALTKPSDEQQQQHDNYFAGVDYETVVVPSAAGSDEDKQKQHSAGNDVAVVTNVETCHQVPVEEELEMEEVPIIASQVVEPLAVEAATITATTTTQHEVEKEEQESASEVVTAVSSPDQDNPTPVVNKTKDMEPTTQSFSAITLQQTQSSEPKFDEESSTISYEISTQVIVEAAPINIEMSSSDDDDDDGGEDEDDEGTSDEMLRDEITVVTTMPESLTASSEFSSLDQPSTLNTDAASSMASPPPQLSPHQHHQTQDDNNSVSSSQSKPSNDSESEDVKSTLPKQRIDVIQTSTNGYHEKPVEQPREMYENGDDDEEEELALTPARYPSNGGDQYFLQQATFANGKSDEVYSESVEAAYQNDQSEVVQNDLKAVKPEELEEVRRHGVAASLRRQWESNLNNKPSQDEQLQQSQQAASTEAPVSSGTARNLKKLFESNAVMAQSTTLPASKALGGSVNSLKWRCKTPEHELNATEQSNADKQNGNAPKWNVMDPREVSKRLSHTPRMTSDDQISAGSESSAKNGSNDALEVDSGASSIRGDDENLANGNSKTVFENTPVVREDTVRAEDTTLSELEQLRQASAARNVRNVFQQLLASSNNESPATPAKAPVTPKKIVLNRYSTGNPQRSPSTERVVESEVQEAPKPAPGTARAMTQLFNGGLNKTSNQSPEKQSNYRWRVDDPRERSRQLKQADVRSGDAATVQGDVETRKPSLVVIQSQK